MTDHLSNYRTIFKEMIENNDPAVFGNSSRDHAAVIIQELINSAAKSVTVLCTKLAQDIYGDERTIEAIKKALFRGVKFNVLVKDPAPESMECFFLLHSFNPDFIKANHVDISENDFCVIDSVRYRHEIDETSGQAEVSAYSPGKSDSLLKSIAA